MPKQNVSPAEYPQAVLRQITLLGQNIAIARRRRGETQAQWARRLGVSQPTMARIERGDPSVAMASYVMCMWLVNQAEGLADLIAPPRDQAALEREVARAGRQRRRPVRPSSEPAVPATEAATEPEHAVHEPAAPWSSSAMAMPPALEGPRNATADGLAALLAQPPQGRR